LKLKGLEKSYKTGAQISKNKALLEEHEDQELEEGPCKTGTQISEREQKAS